METDLKYKHYWFFGVWAISLVVAIWASDQVLIAIPWIFVGFFAYIIFRFCNQEPPPVERSSSENQNHYADHVGAGGALAGVLAGAQIGAGIGIVEVRSEL